MNKLILATTLALTMLTAAGGISMASETALCITHDEYKAWAAKVLPEAQVVLDLPTIVVVSLPDVPTDFVTLFGDDGCISTQFETAKRPNA